MNYIYNPLEDQVKKLYQQLSINVPEEIDMIDIATKLDINLYFEEIGSKAIDKNGVYSIFIDTRLTLQEQWQDFGHELCHVLRHSGNQLSLPWEFVLYQESKARNFAYHFCIPTFMLEQLDMPSQKKEAVELIAVTFNTKLDFAKVRLEKWLQQQQSYLFYEKVSEPNTVYEQEIKGNNVIQLESDINDEPAPPEMIEEVCKELKIESFSCRGPITIGLIYFLKEEFKNIEVDKKFVIQK